MRGTAQQRSHVSSLLRALCVSMDRHGTARVSNGSAAARREALRRGAPSASTVARTNAPTRASISAQLMPPRLQARCVLPCAAERVRTAFAMTSFFVPMLEIRLPSQMAAEGRRMAALREGFGRALEGATGACGFEARGGPARAPAAVSPAALNGPDAPRRAAAAGVQGVLRAPAGGVPRHNVRRLLPGARLPPHAPHASARLTPQLSFASRAVCAAAARHDAGEAS